MLRTRPYTVRGNSLVLCARRAEARHLARRLQTTLDQLKAETTVRVREAGRLNTYHAVKGIPPIM